MGEPHGISLNNIQSFVNQMAQNNKIKYHGGINPDRNDDYVKYAGNICNKWIGPVGFWGSNRLIDWSDRTILTIFKFQGDRVVPIYSRFLHNPSNGDYAPIDARITNINTIYNFSPTLKCYSFYINGSSTHNSNWPLEGSVYLGSKNKDTIIDPSMPVVAYNNGVMIKPNPGWKEALTRIQIILKNNGDTNIACTFSHHPELNSRNFFTDIESSTVEAYANCITWQGRTEKNWILHYYYTIDVNRTFCQEKCVLLNYCLAGLVNEERGEKGMIFYWKNFDASNIDPNNRINNVLNGKQLDNEWDVTDWNLIVSPNSNIFYNIEEEFNLHISCTTPFIEIENSLYGVAHIKIDIFKYLNTKIQECIDMNVFGRNEREYFPNIKRYLQGELVNGLQIPSNNICSCAFQLIEWSTVNIYNNAEHGVAGDKKYIQDVHETYGVNDNWVNWSMLEDENNAVRDYCVDCGFIEQRVGGWWRCIRSLHPNTQYFMFFYKFNKHTLELESFSHPFIIVKDNEPSFLNFPMGLTTNSVSDGEPHIWLSYGEGDCGSCLVDFTRAKFDELTNQNNNDTNIFNIRFLLYGKDGDYLETGILPPHIPYVDSEPD